MDPRGEVFNTDRDIVDFDTDKKNEKLTWQETFNIFLRKPSGIITLFTLGLLTLLPHKFDKVRAERKPVSSIEFLLRDEVADSEVQSRIHFQDWTDFNPPADQDKISLASKKLADIIIGGGDEPYWHIKNDEAFNAWIDFQFQDKELLAVVGITKIEDATPKDLIELSIAITEKALEYDPMTSQQLQSNDLFTRMNASSHLEDTDQSTADEILMQKKPAVCRHLAGCAKAIFEKLKERYPEKLTNIHMTEAWSSEMGHAWDAVYEVTGPLTIEAAFIDPTFAEGAGIQEALKATHSAENFTQLLHNFELEGHIESGTLFFLAADYFNRTEAPIKEEYDFIYKSFPRTAWEKGQKIEILKHFLKRSPHEITKLQGKQDYEFAEYFAYEELRDLMLDPTNFERPDDWWEQANNAQENFARLTPDEEKRKIEQMHVGHLPKTPEAYFYYKYMQELSWNMSKESATISYRGKLEFDIPRIRKWAAEHNKTNIWWRK